MISQEISDGWDSFKYFITFSSFFIVLRQNHRGKKMLNTHDFNTFGFRRCYCYILPVAKSHYSKIPENDHLSSRSEPVPASASIKETASSRTAFNGVVHFNDSTENKELEMQVPDDGRCHDVHVSQLKKWRFLNLRPDLATVSAGDIAARTLEVFR